MKHQSIFFFTTLTLIISSFTSYAVAENIKIGALLCLSGACADIGENSLKGIQLAIDQIKEKDGDQIDLVLENSDELNGSAPVSAYHSLRRKLDNAFIIGPTWSIGGMAIAPIVAKDPKVLLMSPSLGVREFKEFGDNLFCVWPHDDVGTKELAKRAFSRGQKHLAIIAHIAPWDLAQAKTFKETIIKLGGTVDPYIEYQTNELDLKTYALKIVKSKADAVYLSNFAQAGIFSRELNKYGYKGVKYASYMDRIQIEQAKGNLEGVEFNFQPEGSEDFSTAYLKKFNEKPNTSADTAYDALNLIYKSIKETKSQDPAVVSKHLLTIKNYHGASGEITFDEKGGITRPPAFFVLKGEKYERVE